MANKYTLEAIHNGTNSGDFCVFQTYDGQTDDIRPLAWYCKKGRPGIKLIFEWSTDYSMVWGEQGDLLPGVVFKASLIENADLGDITKNMLLFTMEKGAFRFGLSNNPTKSGKLGVVCDSMIPSRRVSVGLAMSGKPAQACVASPGLQYTFHPHPRYWIAFGRFEEGEVLDLGRMTQKFEITYPINTHCRTVVLKPDNTWMVQ